MLPAAPEVRVALALDGELLARWTCSPRQLQELAAGWLLGKGYIRAPHDLLNLHVGGDESAGILLTVHTRLIGDSNGPREGSTIDRSGLPSRVAPPPLENLPGLFRELYARSAHRDTGGMHAAALADGAELRYHAEDVGRHNAVAKAIGACCLAADEPSRLGLVLSARISGDIAERCANAGIAWVASRSIPTTLALEIAEAAQLPLIGRAAAREPYLYLPSDVPRTEGTEAG